MITLASFLNPDGDEASAIGRLYYDVNNNERYLEMRQAEDYIAFDLVDDRPSNLPPTYYGLNGHRKVESRRVGIDDARQMLELEQGKKLHLDDTWSEGVLLVARYQQGAGFACALGSYGKVLRVLIDEDDWDALTFILRAMVNAYDEAQERKVYETRPRWVWDALVERLESWEASPIREQYEYSGYGEDDEVTIAFADKYDRDRVLLIETEDTYPGWRRLIARLREDGKEALAKDVEDKLAEHEYGHNESMFVILEFDFEIGIAVRDAQESASLVEVALR